MMAPSELAKQCLRAAEGGSAEAQTQLGWFHRRGEEGLEQDNVKAAALFREAADLGHPLAGHVLARCYHAGEGLDQNYAQAAEWGRKAADQGNARAQLLVGKMYAYGKEGVKKDLPLGKQYLKLCAAQQGDQDAENDVALLKELRKCASCGKLDVHHMICAWCRNVRYCGGTCQLRHWQRPTDPHKPHCGRRREVAGAGGVASDPTADDNECAMEVVVTVEMEAAKVALVAASAAAAAAVTAVSAARAAAEAAPAGSKKEKKKKAQLVAKVKAAEATRHAAETAAQAAETVARAAGDATLEAEAVM